MTLMIEGYQHARNVQLTWVQIEGTYHKVREFNESLFANKSTVTYCGRRTSTPPFAPIDLSPICSECGL